MLQGIGSLSPSGLRLSSAAQGTAGSQNASFGEYLTDALRSVDQLQKEADQAAEALAAGDLDDLHHVMIVAEQAQLSLQLTVQVVNKIIQSYQEIYRMQV